MAAHEEDYKLHFDMAMNTVDELLEQLNEVTTKLEDCKQINNPICYDLTDFQESKDNDEVVCSFAYYISTNGYRMALVIYPNGNCAGEGSHVSVYAESLKGKYDAKLKWPFVGKITFALLNQLEDKNHHQKTAVVGEESNVNISYGYSKFIPHSELGYDPVKNTQYLKDDTLYFRMSVEVPDSKPWLE